MALLDDVLNVMKDSKPAAEYNEQEKRYASLAANFVQEIHDILDSQIKEAELNRREAMDIFWHKLRDIEMRSMNKRKNNETAESKELAERTCEDEDECGANEDE